MNKMTVRECVIKNRFNFKLVLEDLKQKRVRYQNMNGYTLRQYAFLVTLNWAKKLNKTETMMRYL